jgi:hypothetical protein
MSIGNKSTRDKRLNNGTYAITDSQNATQRNNRLSLFNSVKDSYFKTDKRYQSETSQAKDNLSENGNYYSYP